MSDWKHYYRMTVVGLAASIGVCLAACSQNVASDIETSAGDRLDTGRTHGVRSAVVAPKAAAATAHPLATQIALDIMKQGGSAMDAAIAANAMLGLVEPTGNGIGGDLFAIVWDPENRDAFWL